MEHLTYTKMFPSHVVYSPIYMAAMLSRLGLSQEQPTPHVKSDWKAIFMEICNYDGTVTVGVSP